MIDLLWAAPNLIAEATTTGEIAVLTIEGELDSPAIEMLISRIAELVDTGARSLILDLGTAAFAHIGLDLIAELLRGPVATGAAVAIADAPYVTVRALRLMGLDNVVTIYDTVAEAWAAAVGKEPSL